MTRTGLREARRGCRPCRPRRRPAPPPRRTSRPPGSRPAGGAGSASSAVEQVAQVEVGVAATAGVDVDVGQLAASSPRWRSAAARSPRRPRAAAASHGVSPASTCPPGWTQMPSRRWRSSTMPRGPDDERRAGDVDRVGVLVERPSQPGHGGQDLVDAGPLALVDRAPGRRPRRAPARSRPPRPSPHRRHRIVHSLRLDPASWCQP